MRDLPRGLLGAPFTIAQARACGVTEDMLRGRRLRRLLPGVYVAAEVPDSLVLRCRAAALILPPAAAFSHETAVRLLGLPLPYRTMRITHDATRTAHDATRTAHDATATTHDATHVSVPAAAGRPRITGLTGHRSDLADGDVAVRKGLRVTSPERTFCDVAATGWVRNDLVVLADAMLRWSGEPGRGRLGRRVDSWGSRHGARRMREALGLCVLRVDSPPETLVRLLLRDAGLPPPEVNLPVVDGYGEPVHTPDLSWPAYRYALDYDGEHHLVRDRDDDVLAGRRDNWRRRHDLHRQENLRAHGWLLGVVTAYDLFRTPDALLSRVRRDLRERGAPA